MPHDNKREINKQLGTIRSISLQTMQNLPKVSVMVVTAHYQLVLCSWTPSLTQSVRFLSVRWVLCFDLIIFISSFPSPSVRIHAPLIHVTNSTYTLVVLCFLISQVTFDCRPTDVHLDAHRCCYYY